MYRKTTMVSSLTNLVVRHVAAGGLDRKFTLIALYCTMLTRAARTVVLGLVKLQHAWSGLLVSKPRLRTRQSRRSQDHFAGLDPHDKFHHHNNRHRHAERPV